MKKHLSCLLLLALTYSFSSLALAEKNSDNKEKIKRWPTATYMLGSDASFISVGLGGWQDEGKTFQNIYISHFEVEDTLKVNGVNLGKQEYSSTRLGVFADTFSYDDTPKKSPPVALSGGAFIYKNESEGPIDRYGIGVTMHLGHLLTPKTKAYLGADVMLEPFSTNWDANAFLEYDFQAGLTQRVTSFLDIMAIYRKGGSWDARTDSSHYSVALAGLRVAF
ncbi:hypothetical protein SAMN05660443_0563 [Marinospirillum celere]|uniref:Outer membrane protein beta-barrel domain-containing protein n=1 Tax=Marinospirillum celere TaxID=1122252 RepID=A0A1I1EL18_9GAMM|nr:hypothetical protein [Marinospirillum celere]SFB85660.1 hypothetical protein SAMN05660443_0563 [Marinospirillum celere]